MSANIRGYVGRQSAWHSLGEVRGEFFTWQSALQSAKLDFHVFKSQLRDGLGQKVPAWGTFRWDLADKLAKDSSKAKFLGVVGEDYKVIQHSEGFKLIDSLVGTVNGAHYETLGALGAGEKVWGLVKLSETKIRVGDDEMNLYLLICTGHDGSLSFQIRLCAERVVCWNTLLIALSERGRASYKVRHTKNAGTRIATAQEAIQSIGETSQTMSERLNFLATRQVTRESAEGIFNRLFPKTAADASTDSGDEKSSTRRNNILADILARYESNDGNIFPEQKGTAYNLLNAVTEFTDHARGSSKASAKTRAESALFGSGEDLKSKAFEVILESANGMPVKAVRRAFVPVIAGESADVATLGLV